MTRAAERTTPPRTARRRPAGLPGHILHFFLLSLAFAPLGWPHRVLAARAAGSVSVGSGQGTIHPGEEVALAWTALPEGADEFELLLVCRSPIAVKVRLTECLDPSQGTFRWRVPNLPCDAARILIRAGVRGQEITWAASSPFRIGWDTHEPFVEVTSRGGELWLSDSSPKSRETCAWGPDSASPGGPAGRSEDVGAPPPAPDLGPPHTSSCETVPFRPTEEAGVGSRPIGPLAHFILQLRI